MAVDDQLWTAIGDPTRRRVLDLLSSGAASTATALSERLPVSRQAIAKHLQVLDRAGLVTAVVAGKERRYRVDEDRLGAAAAELTEVGATWDRRLRRIKAMAEDIARLDHGPAE